MFSSSLDLCFSQTLCLRSLDNRDIIARGQYRHCCHKRFNKYMGNGFYVNHEFMLSDFGTHMKQTVASNTDKMNSKLIYGIWIRGNYAIVFIAGSARAVTGRWCPHSGEGEDFLTGQLNFLRKLL